MGESRKISDIKPFAELARGGTATVYKAYQESLDRVVLLKVLHPEHAADDELVGRFENEARLAARVQHPNIVSVFDCGREEDQMYVLTEFVEGQSLADLVQKGRLPVNISLYILREVARGLKAVHDKGIIHRDIKPSNILIANDGKIKVADFGMASLLSNVQNSDVRGTLAYIPPELLLGKSPTEASDLFSLGASLLEMLTGRPAFVANDASKLMDAILHEDPLPVLKMVDMSPRTRRLVQMLLKKQPDERYASIDVMLRDLEQVQQTEGRASALDLKQFMEDPDAYRDKQRESDDETVRVAGTARKPAKPKPAAPKKAAPAKRKKIGSNRRWMQLLGLIVLLVGGGFLVNTFLGGSVGVGSSSGSSSGNSGGQSATPASTTSPPPPASQSGSSSQQPEQDPPPVQADQSVAVEETPEQPQDLPQENIEDQEAVTEPIPADETTAGPEQIPMGQLRVVAEPWAAVFVDVDSMGVTPATLPLRAGSYWITLKRPGFPDVQSEVDIRQGEETPLEVSLWRYVGKLSVEVVPWAEVYIDGVHQDQTPLDQPLIVSPGRHTISLEHPTLGRQEDEFVILAGEEKTLTFNLNR